MTKTGAPTNAVMTPVANSWGVKSVRAIISASNNKSAPTQAERGAERADPLIPDAGQSAVLAGRQTNGASNRYGCATEQRDRKQGKCSRAEYRDAQPLRHAIAQCQHVKEGAR